MNSTPSDRDGTSQRARRLAALDPDQARVDERTLADWLAFARRYTEELRYYDDRNQPQGDWSHFFPAELEPEEIAAFLEQAEEADIPSSLRRPHFVLFLAFLDMLRQLQIEMNTLAERHLDFYYRQVLRLVAGRPVADRVHVAFEPAADTEHRLLPAGTELSAGPDSLEIDRIYRTEREVPIGPARIAELRTITVDRGPARQSDQPVPDLPSPESSTPNPRAADWRNIYSNSDAPAIAASPGSEGGLATWPLFGELPQPSIDAEPEARIGWAIASPLLALREGERALRVGLVFEPESFDTETQAAIWNGESPEGPSAFRIELTTAEGWFRPDNVAAEIRTSRRNPESQLSVAALITVYLDTAAPPIEALADSPESEPMVRVRLRPSWDSELGGWRIPRRELSALRLVEIWLSVSVAQLRHFELENDRGSLDASKPFEPFGPTPTVGSRLAIGHPDWVDKPLESLVFEFEWVDAPNDPQAYYSNYQLDPPPPFRARVDLVEASRSHALSETAELLPGNELLLPRLPELPEPSTPVSELPEGDLARWPRYVVWQLLAPDFGHSSYPRVSARKALQLTAALAEGGGEGTTIDVEDFEVNPPYTPVLRDLRANYSASTFVRAAVDGRHRFFHVHPFGHSEPEDNGEGWALVPEYPEDGQLLIGIEGLRPPQSLTLWFQLDEGSADPESERGTLSWSYLDADRWIELPASALRQDSTAGFIRSGILELSLPAAEPSIRQMASRGSSDLPAETLYWLRVRLDAPLASVARVESIRPHAALAIFEDRGNAEEHYERPLPPSTLVGPVSPLPGIAAVHQPHASFGGRAAEPMAAFSTRVSERLRHRDRASTIWDVERLVLEHFPEIYKAKCLPATEDRPGHIRVIVVPDIRHRAPFDPFEPKASSSLLAAIRTLVESKAPSPATVEVSNPHYVHLEVRLAVRFRDDGNTALHRQQLEADIRRFLAPWAFDDSADLEIGNRIFANSLLSSIERRSYVDYVAYPRFFLSEDGEQFHAVEPSTDPKTGYFATARPHQVLVPARQHVIDVITEENFEEEEVRGIGFMAIELDFVVGPR